MIRTQKVKSKALKTISMVLVLTMALFVISPAVSVSAATGNALNSENETIYYVDDDYAEAIGALPDGYNTSFQFSLSGTYNTIKWSVSRGNTVTISENGLVEPVIETWYWYNTGNGYSIGMTTKQDGKEPDKITHKYKSGESTICCTADGKKYYATVNVSDYSDIYVQNEINNFLSEKINDSMSTYDKVNAICKYVAGFNYDYHYSSYKAMVICKGGDCWASSYLILHLCDKLGINAKLRYAAHDSGAGSGHRNVIVDVDGEIYVADAGYYTSAPRYYVFQKFNDGYSLKSTNGGYSIYQYDGFDQDVTIPSSINGKNITAISDLAFYYGSPKPTSIYIPKTITSISDQALSFVSTLQKVTVSADNPNYCDINGVVYTKDKSTMIALPGAYEGKYKIADGTKTIGSYAVFGVDNLTDVFVPNGVTTINANGIVYSDKLETISLPPTVTTLGEKAFFKNNNLKSIYIPDSVTSIGDSIVNKNTVIYGGKGSAAEKYANENECSFVETKLGDANLDGNLTIADTSKIQRYIAQFDSSLDKMQLQLADYNHDGVVDIHDATDIQRTLAGIK